MASVSIQVDNNLLQLAASVEKDVSKAVNEALQLWLKKRIIICPITNHFCTNRNEPCNDCDTTKKLKTPLV